VQLSIPLSEGHLGFGTLQGIYLWEHRMRPDRRKSSFDRSYVQGPRARFVVARTKAGIPVGCGAFRPMGETVAEVKRMYAVPGTVGVGSVVLAHLESEATKLGYSELWLETRVVNERAVAFYEHRGYSPIPSFGKYVGRREAACLAKRLPANATDG
jgi:GNAT superfamily N-acetyltransferase